MEEKPPSQKKIIDYDFIRGVLDYTDETGENVPERILTSLMDNIDDPQAYNLLTRYLQKNLEVRLPDVLRMINFDFSTNPKSFDAYDSYREAIAQILEEKDGVIDSNKREQARQLLKAMKDFTVPK